MKETSRSDGICHWDKPATRFTSGLIIFGARAAPSLSRLFLHFLASSAGINKIVPTVQSDASERETKAGDC